MRVVFIGTGEIGVPTLEALRKSEHELAGVITQPDKPAGRDQKISPSPIKTAAARAKLPVLQPSKIKNTESVTAIAELRPDVIVVAAYGQILPRSVLQLPKLGCLNVHVSLLPRWRGAAPIQAAIAAGDRETGVTIMYMDEGLDTGDILLQRKIDIDSNETGDSLHDRLAQLGPAALLESLRSLENGTAPRIRQDEAQATYAPKLSRENGRIDWKQDAASIERQIRAFNPWPGAFTEISSRHLKIFSATVVDLSGAPGEILRGDNELVIAANDRAISLGEVQLEGKRRMNAGDFVRGFDLTSASAR